MSEFNNLMPIFEVELKRGVLTLAMRYTNCVTRSKSYSLKALTVMNSKSAWRI